MFVLGILKLWFVELRKYSFSRISSYHSHIFVYVFISFDLAHNYFLLSGICPFKSQGEQITGLDFTVLTCNSLHIIPFAKNTVL